MAWSGGVFTRANGDTGWQDDAAALIGIEADLHDAQDNDFKNGINNTLTKDGQNTPTANLPMDGNRHTGVGLAVAATDYVRYDQALALIPTGTIWQYAATAAPSGWLTCDGTAVSRASYATLFALISTTYGIGDGSTTFNLPDLQRRTPIGKGSSDSLGNSDGIVAGSRVLTHTHSTPAHYHGMGTGATLNITSSGTHTTDINHDHGSFTSGAGSPHSHTNTIAAFAPSTAGTRVSNTSSSASQTNNTTAITIDNESAHTHAVDVPAFTGNSASTGAHTHAAGNIAGTIGLVTGGVDGNAAMTSGAQNNTNYLVLHYIIKT